LIVKTALLEGDIFNKTNLTNLNTLISTDARPATDYLRNAQNAPSERDGRIQGGLPLLAGAGQ
jgi:hypothetical protein